MDSSNRNKTEHRYRAESTSTGFVLDGGADRQRVRVNLLEACWQVVPEDSDDVGPVHRFGFFDVRRLIDWVTQLSFARWMPRSASAPEWKLRKWAEQKARRSIAWVVGRERQRLLAKRVDPLILQTQRAIFAACLHTNEIVHEPDFYRWADRHLLNDIHRYRAAAIAVNLFGEDLRRHHLQRLTDSLGEDSDRSANAFATFQACQRLQWWRTLLSDTGRTYSAMNRTLDQLPGSLSPLLVCQLATTHLPRPITDRLELNVLLLSLDRQAHPHQRIFQFASRREILTAMTRISRALQQDLSPRRTFDLGLFVQYLCDYPETHSGNIIGLAKQSIRFHRHLATQQAASANVEADDEPMAAPPAPVPALPGLRFLDTAGAIRREGALMRHCIASYIPKARTGSLFLFHYDHEGEMASVEVDAQGRVTQAFGPQNTTNSAARKARSILSVWGRPLPRRQVVGPPVDSDIPF